MHTVVINEPNLIGFPIELLDWAPHYRYILRTAPAQTGAPVKTFEINPTSCDERWIYFCLTEGPVDDFPNGVIEMRSQPYHWNYEIGIYCDGDEATFHSIYRSQFFVTTRVDEVTSNPQPPF